LLLSGEYLGSIVPRLVWKQGAYNQLSFVNCVWQ
jgi:hypothetical protein